MTTTKLTNIAPELSAHTHTRGSSIEWQKSMQVCYSVTTISWTKKWKIDSHASKRMLYVESVVSAEIRWLCFMLTCSLFTSGKVVCSSSLLMGRRDIVVLSGILSASPCAYTHTYREKETHAHTHIPLPHR